MPDRLVTHLATCRDREIGLGSVISREVGFPTIWLEDDVIGVCLPVGEMELLSPTQLPDPSELVGLLAVRTGQRLTAERPDLATLRIVEVG